MAQMEVKKLDSGDLFPAMNLNLTGGTTLSLPEMVKGKWAVLLVYRGRW
jgi:peroxiredoxin